MMPIPTAVVGVGFQGRRHAQKLAALENSKLVAVVDIDMDRARDVAAELGVEATDDWRDLIGEVSAVTVATPTLTHFDIASALLRGGIHVLVEKPMATAMDEARDLVDIAESNNLVLQVGHLERFNPVVVAMTGHVTRPRFVESNRIAPFKHRGLDVSVVFDLMVHDIDIIHSFVGSPMKHVDAVGQSVFTDNIDVVNARIEFVDGCVANVTSSRISLKTERTLRIFQPDSYFSADLHNLRLAHYSRKGTGPIAGPEHVRIDKKSFAAGDAMMEQARAFLNSVAGGPPPLADGRVALDTLKIATAISASCLAFRGRVPLDTLRLANR